jgi:hypothetical protein
MAAGQNLVDGGRAGPHPALKSFVMKRSSRSNGGWGTMDAGMIVDQSVADSLPRSVAASRKLLPAG